MTHDDETDPTYGEAQAEAERELAIRHKYVVAVYIVDRAYGGPEEGGWWFDVGDRVRLMQVFPSMEPAYAYCRRLNDKLETSLNRGRRELSSVLSTGRYAAEVHEDDAPLSYPEHQPHYE